MSDGIIAVLLLAASLIGGKFILDWLVQFEWPVVVYIALLSVIGYGPPLWWAARVARRRSGESMWRAFGARPQWLDLAWGPLIWLACVGCQIVAGIIVTIAGIPTESNTEGLDQLAGDRTYVVAVIVTAVIAAPIVEELVFRGVVMRSLLSRMGAVLAIAGQAMLFGVAHVDPVRGAGNLGLVIVLSVVGAALGAAAYWLRRVAPTIVAHAILNGVVLTIVFTGVLDRLTDAA